MYPLIPKTIIDNAENIADYVFNKTVELAIIVAERRRKLACWRKIKFAAVIRLTNEDRIARGKRPRRMPLWRRRLRIATAECEANCKADPRFAVAHQAADLEIATLELMELVHRAPKMTDEQREAQRRSFAYGNLKMSRPDLAMGEMDAAADAMRKDEEA